MTDRMDDLRLIPLALDHLDQVLELEQLCFAAPWSRDAYAAEFDENSLAHYCGVCQGPRLLAFAGFWQIVDEGHIVNVAVHPDFRGQGLAKLLLTRMITVCRALGGHAMTLEVRESNAAARRLYEKMGFASAGLRPRYYDNGENAVIMWKELE